MMTHTFKFQASASASDMNDHVVPSYTANSNSSPNTSSDVFNHTFIGSSLSSASPPPVISPVHTAQNMQSNHFLSPAALSIDMSNNRRWQWPMPSSTPVANASVPQTQQRATHEWNVINGIHTTNMHNANAIGPNYAPTFPRHPILSPPLQMNVNSLPYPTLHNIASLARNQRSCPHRIDAQPHRSTHSSRHSRRNRPSRLQHPEYSQRFGT